MRKKAKRPTRRRSAPPPFTKAEAEEYLDEIEFTHRHLLDVKQDLGKIIGGYAEAKSTLWGLYDKAEADASRQKERVADLMERIPEGVGQSWRHLMWQIRHHLKLAWLALVDR